MDFQFGISGKLKKFQESVKISALNHPPPPSRCPDESKKYSEKVQQEIQTKIPDSPYCARERAPQVDGAISDQGLMEMEYRLSGPRNVFRPE